MLTSAPRSDADFYRGNLKRRKSMTNRHRQQRLRAMKTLHGLMPVCEHRPLLSDRRISLLTLEQRPNAGEVPPATTKIMQSAKLHGKKIEASYLRKPTPQGLVTFVERRRRRRLSILRVSSTVSSFNSGPVRLRARSWY